MPEINTGYNESTSEFQVGDSLYELNVAQPDEIDQAKVEIERLKKVSPFHKYANWSNDIILSYHKETNNHSMLDIIEQVKKLKNLFTLEQNWELEKIGRIEDSIISRIKNIVSNPSLKAQPDIFPTFRNSVQIEYEKENGNYLEFEFFHDRILMLKIENNKESEQEVLLESIIELINNFNE